MALFTPQELLSSIGKGVSGKPRNGPREGSNDRDHGNQAMVLHGESIMLHQFAVSRRMKGRSLLLISSGVVRTYVKESIVIRLNRRLLKKWGLPAVKVGLVATVCALPM